MKITDIHKKLIREIGKNPNATLKKLGIVTGIHATATVDYHLKALMAEGLLRRGNKWEVVRTNQTRTSDTKINNQGD